MGYQPKRFQHYDNYSYNNGENDSPDTDDLFGTPPRSTSLLSDRESPDGQLPFRREEGRDDRDSIARSGFTPKSSFDSICSTRSGTTGLSNLGNAGDIWS